MNLWDEVERLAKLDAALRSPSSRFSPFIPGMRPFARRRAGGQAAAKQPNFVFGDQDPVIATADLSLAAWNTVATHRMFTITGAVQIAIVYKITETIASGGALTMDFGYLPAIGVAYSAAAILLASLVADRLIVPAGATGTVFNISAFPNLNAGLIMLGTLAIGNSAGYRINVAAATDGTIVARAYWMPLEAGATVVAGDGSVM